MTHDNHFHCRVAADYFCPDSGCLDVFFCNPWLKNFRHACWGWNRDLLILVLSQVPLTTRLSLTFAVASVMRKSHKSGLTFFSIFMARTWTVVEVQGWKVWGRFSTVKFNESDSWPDVNWRSGGGLNFFPDVIAKHVYSRKVSFLSKGNRLRM